MLLPSLPPQSMAQQDWTPSTITPGHQQKFMKQEFMAATELKACHVPLDPMFPAPEEQCMVFFVVFYEWGFGTP
jgi:hypothetical protein